MTVLLKCVNIFRGSGLFVTPESFQMALDWSEPWWHDNEVVFLLMVLSSVSSSVEMLQRADRVPSTGISTIPPPPPSSQSLPVLAALFPIGPLLSAPIVFMEWAHSSHLINTKRYRAVFLAHLGLNLQTTPSPTFSLSLSLTYVYTPPDVD